MVLASRKNSLRQEQSPPGSEAADAAAKWTLRERHRDNRATRGSPEVVRPLGEINASLVFVC